MARVKYRYTDDFGEVAGVYYADFALLAPLTAANTGGTPADATDNRRDVVRIDTRTQGIQPRYVRARLANGKYASVIAGTQAGLLLAAVVAGVTMVRGESFDVASTPVGP